jgi:Holliday junction resolvase RusA-like endonuclease
MATWTAPHPAPHPAGYPRAFVAGRALSLGFFIPAKEFKYRNGMEFDVPAKERPQARIITGKKPFAQFYTPKKTVEWEQHVGEHALLQLRAVELDGDDDFTLPVKDCRVIMHLRFNLRKPSSYPKSVIHAVKKPDLDNLQKAILDGLVQAQVIDDDNCITDLSVMKRYADDDHPMGVEVDLTCLPT